MNLQEALKAVIEDDAVIACADYEGRKKQIKSMGKAVAGKHVSFQQRLYRIFADEWLEWDDTPMMLSLKEIESGNWHIVKDKEETKEDGMGIAEAIAELFKRDYDSIMYRKGDDRWIYKLGGARYIGQILQKNKKSERPWHEVTQIIEFTRDMLTEKDWVVEDADSMEEEKSEDKEEKDCNHALCKMMKEIFKGAHP